MSKSLSVEGAGGAAEGSVDWRIDVASQLQAILLNELGRVREWRRDELVFHGGTSFKVRWGSPRFSEDLDFMVARQLYGDLQKFGEACVERLRRVAAQLWPGCEIGVSMKSRDNEEGESLHRWDVRWYPPSRQGKVTVKLEFYATDPALLAEYGAKPHVPREGMGRVRVTSALPMAEMTALWGDKVKAVATRAAFKWRDAHDLGFLHDALERAIRAESRKPEGVRVDHEAAMGAALETSARIYGKTPEELLPLLRERLDSGVFDDYASFAEDMRKWFRGEEAEPWADGEYARARLDAARQEIERAVAMLEARAVPASPK